MIWLQDYYNTLDKNIPLDRAIADAGYRSIRQFCSKNGIHYGTVANWRNGKPFRQGPLEKEMFNCGFSLTMKRLMRATGCLEWELFPSVFNEEFYKRVQVDDGVIKMPAAPFHPTIEDKEARHAINRILRTLTSREREVIRTYFNLNGDGDENFASIGRKLGLTRERIRVLFRRAIRKLQKPSRVMAIEEAFGKERKTINAPI